MDSRQTTILFADVSESTKLYEAAGDKVAHEAIGRCIEAMRASTLMTGGRVVKTIGDEILAIFGSADAAAAAASEMQVVVNMMKPVADRKLGLRIGFHSGPVLQENDDVFGDTVNIAARLVAQAVKGQIITSAETAALLGPVVRSSTRDLYAIEVKGKTQDVKLCELVWRRNDEDTTILSSGRPLQRRGVASAIHLKYRGKELVRRRDNDSVTLGRDETSGLVIAEDKCSRHHCTIERRGDKFVLADTSSNGTYVTIQGEEEVQLKREEMALTKRGWIAFGQPRAAAKEAAVEFICY